MFEVDSSKLAESKVQDKSVKDFARKMIDDHGTANAKLETIAGEQKLTVPKELDAKHKGDVDTLQNGEDPIDGPYVQMQRDAHAIERFRNRRCAAIGKARNDRAAGEHVRIGCQHCRCHGRKTSDRI